MRFSAVRLSLLLSSLYYEASAGPGGPPASIKGLNPWPPGSSGPPPGPGPWSSHGPVKALYLMSDLSPNAVISLSVDEAGVVSDGTLTMTGGDGGAFVDEKTGAPVTRDSLNSQDAVVRAGNVLYVVNAGSNSISSLAIDAQNPTSLTLIGAPTKLIGDFPVTVAVSEELNLVCVGTAGPANGVECFKSFQGHLIPDGVGLRSFGFPEPSTPLFQSNAISDLFFSSDLKWLYAPVRGDMTNTNGFLSVFPIEKGLVSTKDVQSTSDEIKVLFGGLQNPFQADKIFVTDASFGAVVYQISEDGEGTIVGKGVTNPSVPATCWAEYSYVSDSVWVTSPGLNTLVAMDLDTAAVISETNITNPNGGMIDLVVPGKYLYTLASGVGTEAEAAIVVVDISKGSSNPETVQYFPIGFGANNYAHGLAYWA